MSEHEQDGVDPTAAPSGTGCQACDADGGWWFHLRRCAQCGVVGCCDSSPAQHATAHFQETGHPIMVSFEPGEDWGWDYRNQASVDGLVLAPPTEHPADVATPGPTDRLPADWKHHIHR